MADADLERLYATYISATRFTDKIDSVGTRVMDEINQVMAMMDAAVGSASSYTESLTTISDKLGNSKDREGLCAIVESLVATANEMKQNNHALEQWLNASKEEINQLQENLEVVRNESLTDPLTSLSNRKDFDERLAQSIVDSAERSKPLSLVMTDIDHFKNFNDTWGHLTGEQVLRLVAMSMIARADACLYAAKRNGRNRLICETDPKFANADEAKVA